MPLPRARALPAWPLTAAPLRAVSQLLPLVQEALAPPARGRGWPPPALQPPAAGGTACRWRQLLGRCTARRPAASSGAASAAAFFPNLPVERPRGKSSPRSCGFVAGRRATDARRKQVRSPAGRAELLPRRSPLSLLSSNVCLTAFPAVPFLPRPVFEHPPLTCISFAPPGPACTHSGCGCRHVCLRGAVTHTRSAPSAPLPLHTAGPLGRQLPSRRCGRLLSHNARFLLGSWLGESARGGRRGRAGGSGAGEEKLGRFDCQAKSHEKESYRCGARHPWCQEAYREGQQ